MKKLPIALGVSLILALAGCSSSSSGGGNTPSGGGTTTPATTPATTAAPGPVATGAAGIALATKQLKANWATFFNSNTPHATAVKFLQDGTTLRTAVKLAAKVAKAEKTKESAKVLKVTFAAGGTMATVTYNLLGKKGAPPLIASGTGFAVLQNGIWKVAKTTFCTLVSLGASAIGVKNVPGCGS